MDELLDPRGLKRMRDLVIYKLTGTCEMILNRFGSLIKRDEGHS